MCFMPTAMLFIFRSLTEPIRRGVTTTFRFSLAAAYEANMLKLPALRECCEVPESTSRSKPYIALGEIVVAEPRAIGPKGVGPSVVIDREALVVARSDIGNQAARDD